MRHETAQRRFGIESRLQQELEAASEAHEDEDYEPPDAMTSISTQEAPYAVALARSLKQQDAANSLQAFNTFETPVPYIMSQTDRIYQFRQILNRLYHEGTSIETLTNLQGAKKPGFGLVLGSSWSRESWTIVLIRLSTRGSLAWADFNQNTELERQTIASTETRQKLYNYVLYSFRERIDFCLAWLTEEWYCDQLMMRHPGMVSKESYEPQYEPWLSKIIDGIVPFLETRDRSLFVRFLSDLPKLSEPIIRRLRSLCMDPDRASLGYLALQYDLCHVAHHTLQI